MSKKDFIGNMIEKIEQNGGRISGTMQNSVEELMTPIDIKRQTMEEFAATYFDTPEQAAYFISTAKHNNRLNDEPA
jgi:hypothetical protein